MRVSRRERRCGAFSYLSAGVLALAACSRGPDAAQESGFASAKKREPTRVMVEEVVRREMVRRLETTTRVESESQVSFYPRAGGVVVELAVEEGDQVRAGQMLARLDDRDAKLRLDDARAQLDDAQAKVPSLELARQECQSRVENAKRTADQATRDHERNVAISARSGDTPGLISSKDLDASSLAKDRAWADHEAAQLALERAKVDQTGAVNTIQRASVAVERAALELSHTHLTADVGGVIAERSIKVGDTVSTATCAFVITDPTRLRAVFHRPQREFEVFRGALAGAARSDAQGRAAELELSATAEALPGLRFGGRIERVAPTIDAASGNFRVTARLEAGAPDNPGARLLPGMLVRLEIVTERHPGALVVPKRAIRREGDRSTIYVVSAGRARSIEIAEGFTDDLAVEVHALGEAALEAGMQVVVVGNRDLEDGAEVRVTAEQSADSAPAPTAPAATADGK